jgi:hypothetical protein
MAQRKHKDVSPGFTEIAEGLQASEGEAHGILVCIGFNLPSIVDTGRR